MIWQLEESLLTGIAELDSQHQSLVKSVADFYEQGKDCHDMAAEKTLSNRFFTEFSSYALSHFSFEEKLLVQHQYPAYVAHKAEHNAFVQKLIELQWQQNDPGLVGRALFSYVLDWLQHHLRESDKDYIDFFHRKGILK
ncbi:MAG: bacteriohemerythrin [Negativicutes bacterium]|nr:bacteriohemerythrin [Negativicutes bacterium]